MGKGGKLSYLLVFLLLILFMYPFFEGSQIGGKLFAGFFTGVLITGVYALTDHRNRYLVISLLLSVPALVLMWAEQYIEGRMWDILSYAFMAAFTFYIAFRILAHVISAKKVTKDILAGAAGVYLLLGIGWGLLYALVELLAPGSFSSASVSGANTIAGWSTFNYYSFTTLTTLGYGDITPVTDQAQSLTILEAITGVLFTALLIARLVGLYIYHSRKESEA
jgi:hypothetical protein